jgi:hypothetical protein
MPESLKVPSHCYSKEQGITLEHYFERVMGDCKDGCNGRFIAMEKVVDTAKESMEKRLDGMNEFRDALKDQASRFVTRTELLAAVVGISTVISIIVSILMKVMR